MPELRLHVDQVTKRERFEIIVFAISVLIGTFFLGALWEALKR